jgi:transcriptional regulator GlxA family with amidase domain
MEVFGTANLKLREAGRERSTPYVVELAATSNNLCITSTMSGLQLVATKPWSRLSDDIDTILVVGGVNIWTGESNPQLLRWLREQSTKVRRLGSVFVPVLSFLLKPGFSMAEGLRRIGVSLRN